MNTTMGETQEYVLRVQFEEWWNRTYDRMKSEAGEVLYSRDSWDAFKAGAAWVYSLWNKDCGEADKLLRAFGLDPSAYRTEGGVLNVGNIVEAALKQREESPSTGNAVAWMCGGEYAGEKFTTMKALSDRWAKNQKVTPLFTHPPAGHAGLLKDMVRLQLQAAEAARDANQAKIDALMLEYCPDEMTPEQMQTWSENQHRCSPEEEAAINAVLAARTIEAD